MTNIVFPVQRITRRKLRTELLAQGQRMSNWLYNLAQEKDVPSRYQEEAKWLCLGWDTIKSQEPEKP